MTVFGSTAANLVLETAARLAAAGRTLSIRGAHGLTAYVLTLAGLDALEDRAATAGVA